MNAAARALKLLSRSLSGPVDQSAPADQGAGEADEAVVDVEAAFLTDDQTAEPVEQAEGLLDDVAQPSEAFDVLAAAARDDRLGPALSTCFAEGLTVIASVGEQRGSGALFQRPIPNL